MKYKNILLAIIIPATVFTYFFYHAFKDNVISSLPKYNNADTYFSKGFQDSTDYAKYYYSNLNKKELENNEYLKPIKTKDIENIRSYIDNFYQSWLTVHTKSSNDYDFTDNQIKFDDYFYIYTLEDKPIGNSNYGKFDNYTLYYFDIEKQVLYYFHNNI